MTGGWDETSPRTEVIIKKYYVAQMDGIEIKIYSSFTRCLNITQSLGTGGQKLEILK